MKKGVKIFFTVIVFIVIAITAFCVWQRENIRAVYMYISADKGELPSAGILEIPDLPAVDEEDTVQEEANEAGGDVQENTTKSSTATAAVSGKKSDGTATNNTLTLAEKCRKELYACEAALVSRVGGMKNEVLAEWRALPKEQRTSRKRREMIISGVSRCLSLEGEIDGKVKGIIAKYKAQAADAGESTAEITALWEEYKAKKASTKAYYLNKYLG